MTFNAFVKSLNIDFNKYELKESYFDQRDGIHGIQHTYRVMMNVLKVGYELFIDFYTMKWNTSFIEHQTRLAFAGAFIHDMARETNGIEPEHGNRACKTKIHLLHIPISDIKEVQSAVYNHCEPIDLSESHPHYITAMILKDADILDRFRIGLHDKPRFKFEQSNNLVKFARSLDNVKMDINVFKNLIK